MKPKITKVLGVALALVLIASLMVFAIPTAADPFTKPAPTVSNAWVNSYPTPGLLGGWFYNPDIGQVGPIAKGIDGDLYANSVTATTDAVAATGSSTVSGNVGVDLTLVIDNATFDLVYTYTTANIADRIASEVNVGGAFTASSDGVDTVTFTSRNNTDTYNAAGVPVTDGAYWNGHTLGAWVQTTPGADPVAQVDTCTPVTGTATYSLRINPTGGTAVDFTVTGAGGYTATQICDAFRTLIDANTYISSVLSTSGTTTLILTADAPGVANGFTTADLGPGDMGVSTTTAADDGAQLVGTRTVEPGGVSAVDMNLTIDGAVVALAYGDTAAQIAAKIAAAVTAGGTVTTATATGAVVTFTARVPGAAANGNLSVADSTYNTGSVSTPITMAGGADSGTGGTVRFFKSVPTSMAGRSWFQSTAPLAYDGVAVNGGPVVDMVCSSVNEDVLYVTDGNYVYKSVDGGMNFMLVAQASLEFALMGKCGVPVVNKPITCIDLGYNAAGMPIVFIGTKYVGNTYDPSYPDFPNFNVPGSVYYIADEAYPSEWVDLQLRCYGCCNTQWQIDGTVTGCFDVYSVGCAPNFSVNGKVYAAITTDDDDCLGMSGGPSTRIVSNTGTICMWNLVDELFYDCDVTKPFEIRHASRFAFPDDFADTATMFIGVAGTYPTGPGGDVYAAFDTAPPAQDALDLNVQGYTSGCNGLYHANICSLDIMGSTNSASLIAGALDTYEYQAGTDVFYSTDGGWTWSKSAKDPTGEDTTYVLWYDFSPLTAFAGTRGCNCAFSMACGDELGKYWNQISLIGMDISQVWDLTHAPGYVFDDTTMYVLTHDLDSCDQVSGPQPSDSLLRWDGTYWERVFSTLSPEYAIDITKQPTTGYGQMDWAEVSPDFNTTDCLYLANTYFDIFRSPDRGCSWRILSYPCSPKDTISAWIVVDEETVLAAGAGSYAGILYRTTRHGTRPWDEFFIYNSTGSVKACCGVDFDLSLPRAATSDVLLGDACGQVYLSKDLGETWTEIEDALSGDFAGPDDQTYVVFDPGYAVAGDPGENTFYAAAGTEVGRAAYNADAVPIHWQDWLYLSNYTLGVCDTFDLRLASGIDVASDTVLYVSDAGVPAYGGDVLKVDGTIEIECEVNDPSTSSCVGCPRDLDLSPGVDIIPISGTFINNELVEIISYNLVCTLECADPDVLGQNEYCQCRITGEIGLRGFQSLAYGYIVINDILALPSGCDTCSCTEVPNENIGSGNGTTKTFIGTLDHFPVCAGSLTIKDTGPTVETFTDNLDGTLTGDKGGTGTINYLTGVYSVTFHTAPASGTNNIKATYSYATATGDCTGVSNSTVIDSFLQIITTSVTPAAPTGVWRTVDALAMIAEASNLNLTEWEFLGSTHLTSLRHPIASSGFEIYPDDLWLTQASNMLWTLDQVSGVPTDDIWMWDDPLATQVTPVAPTDGALLPTTSTVTLEWDALDGALLYEVKLYKDCPECLSPTKMLEVTLTTSTTAATCLPIEGLLPGTKYFWKVRVACNQPQVSKWSDLSSFDTALAAADWCSPVCGEEGISLTPNLSWFAVIGATGYEVEVATDEAFTNIIASGTPSINAWDCATTLEYNTTYYWRVRSVKDGVYSAWTYCLFSTMAEPTPPVEVTETPVTIVTEKVTPAWIWVIIGIGGALTIAVVILIVTTRRVP